MANSTIILPHEQAHIALVQKFINHLFDMRVCTGDVMAAFIINALHAYSKDIQLVSPLELNGLPCSAVGWQAIARRIQAELSTLTKQQTKQ